jgi:hypothetical protein
MCHVCGIPAADHTEKESQMSNSRKNDEAVAADEWVSLPEASRLLGMHRQKVLTHALKGDLVCDVRGKWTFISRASIDAFLAVAAQ